MEKVKPLYTFEQFPKGPLLDGRKKNGNTKRKGTVVGVAATETLAAVGRMNHLIWC